jgi:hypothetical protein
VRRNRISRVFASVLALWLAVCLAEPVQLHTCAMHGGLPVEQIDGVATHAHAAPAEHLTPAGPVGHSHHDQNTDNESRQCSCLGDCSAGRSSVGIAAPAVLLPAVATVEISGTDFEYASPELVAPGFLLPFSNGPPARSSRA